MWNLPHSVSFIRGALTHPTGVISMRLAELLHDLLLRLKTGQPVALPPAEELTLQEAAQLLQVSAAELSQLMEEGHLLHHQVGSRQVMYREDVLVYQARIRPAETGLDPDDVEQRSEE